MGAEFQTHSIPHIPSYMAKGQFESRPVKIPLIERSNCALYVSINDKNVTFLTVI
jgi:hypothetical protein